MKFILNLKPLSINDAYRGRHWPTAAKTQYERTLDLLIPPMIPLLYKNIWPYFRVEYRFHLVRFKATDTANLEKVLTDCIVRRGYLPDDKHIIDMRLLKFPSKTNRIEVSIEEITQ